MSPVAGTAAGSLDHGRVRTSQQPPPASATAHSVQPSAVVPTPMYFSPEAKITKVIIGLM